MSTNKIAAAKPANQSPKVTDEPQKTESLLIKIDEGKDNFLSLDERLHRLNVLFDLQKRYNRLQDSLHKLKEFSLSHDSDTAYISFRDDERREFTTGNTEVMKEFLEFLKGTIERKIKAIEPLLNW